MSFVSWLQNRTFSGSPRGRAQRRPAAARFQPRLEALEDRWMPSTLKVTNLFDSGPGSLRYEIAQAKSGDTIAFDKRVDGGTITLTSGELDITKNLTIQGPGAGLLTVASNRDLNSGSVSRIFEVESFVTNATLSGMTISNGVGDGMGGGVLNLGRLTISGCVLSGNSAASQGGGIANLGTLTMSACTLSNNYLASEGGGIFNSGTLTMSACTLSNNFCQNGDGGSIFNCGTLALNGSTLSGNYNAYEGGGIYNAGTATVSGCTLTGDSAYQAGGAIYNAGTQSELMVSKSTFSGNTPDNIYGPYTDEGGNSFR